MNKLGAAGCRNSDSSFCSFCEKTLNGFFAVNIGWIWKHIGQESRSVPINAATTQCKQAGLKFLKPKDKEIWNV